MLSTSREVKTTSDAHLGATPSARSYAVMPDGDLFVMIRPAATTERRVNVALNGSVREARVQSRSLLWISWKDKSLTGAERHLGSTGTSE